MALRHQKRASRSNERFMDGRTHSECIKMSFVSGTTNCKLPQFLAVQDAAFSHIFFKDFLFSHCSNTKGKETWKTKTIGAICPLTILYFHCALTLHYATINFKHNTVYIQKKNKHKIMMNWTKVKTKNHTKNMLHIQIQKWLETKREKKHKNKIKRIIKRARLLFII